MAEVFGTAAGVLQVAEVGFSLAATLYKYAASVKGAEKDVKRIARDVKLTSKVLERTHEQIKAKYRKIADQQAQLCTEQALFDLEDVLDGCREAFQEVDEALKGSMKSDFKGDSKVTIVERLKWPLKQNKLDVLRANLEKLKTTLLLMLSVLAYGSKMQQQEAAKTEVKVEFALEKLQIQNLVQAKDEATRRFEELGAAFAKLEASIKKSADQGSDMTRGIEASTIALTTTSIPGAHSSSKNTTTLQGHHHHIVATQLGLCASAVSKLTATIDSATKRWERDSVLEHDPITQCLQESTKAIRALGEHAELDRLPLKLSSHEIPLNAQSGRNLDEVQKLYSPTSPCFMFEEVPAPNDATENSTTHHALEDKLHDKPNMAVPSTKFQERQQSGVHAVPALQVERDSKETVSNSNAGHTTYMSAPSPRLYSGGEEDLIDYGEEAFIFPDMGMEYETDVFQVDGEMVLRMISAKPERPSSQLQEYGNHSDKGAGTADVPPSGEDFKLFDDAAYDSEIWGGPAPAADNLDLEAEEEDADLSLDAELDNLENTFPVKDAPETTTYFTTSTSDDGINELEDADEIVHRLLHRWTGLTMA